MNKINSYASVAIALMLAASASITGALVASAQTVTGSTEPALYNASGVEMNANNATALAAGYYYLAPGAQADTQVYYNGDGTYVDQTTGLYGGSVSDPTGMAGVTLVSGTRAGAVGTVTPGVPDTGEGGNALSAWMTLIATGMIAVGGASYLITRKGQGQATMQ